jgi:hypothetical protein
MIVTETKRRGQRRASGIVEKIVSALFGPAEHGAAAGKLQQERDEGIASPGKSYIRKVRSGRPPPASTPDRPPDRKTSLDQCRQLGKRDHVRAVGEGRLGLGMGLEEEPVGARRECGAR